MRIADRAVTRGIQVLLSRYQAGVQSTFARALGATDGTFTAAGLGASGGLGTAEVAATAGGTTSCGVGGGGAGGVLGTGGADATVPGVCGTDDAGRGFSVVDGAPCTFNAMPATERPNTVSAGQSRGRDRRSWTVAFRPSRSDETGSAVVVPTRKTEAAASGSVSAEPISVAETSPNTGLPVTARDWVLTGLWCSATSDRRTSAPGTAENARVAAASSAAFIAPALSHRSSARNARARSTTSMMSPAAGDGGAVTDRKERAGRVAVPIMTCCAFSAG